MALQFIFGFRFGEIPLYLQQNHTGIHGASQRQYLVLVPEQFTMQTQKELVEMHPQKGIMNIDVLSFERLAFRVLEEVGENQRELLEETGKSMVLRRVAQEKRRELKVLGSKMEKQGYVSQMKSMVSELRQYEIGASDLEELLEDLHDPPGIILQIKGHAGFI